MSVIFLGGLDGAEGRDAGCEGSALDGHDLDEHGGLGDRVHLLGDRLGLVDERDERDAATDDQRAEQDVLEDAHATCGVVFPDCLSMPRVWVRCNVPASRSRVR